MADMYTLFSFELKATQEQAKWLKEVYSTWEQREKESQFLSKSSVETSISEAVKSLIAFDASPVDLNLENLTDGSGLLIYAQSTGSVEYVLLLLKLFLAHFDLSKTIAFEWATICSKMYPDAFGGGAAAVTKMDFTTVTTREILNKLVQ
jgi:hypothetical protein